MKSAPKEEKENSILFGSHSRTSTRGDDDVKGMGFCYSKRSGERMRKGEARRGRWKEGERTKKQYSLREMREREKILRKENMEFERSMSDYQHTPSLARVLRISATIKPYNPITSVFKR